MPVTWCYDVEDGQKYCNPGFPVGCLVSADGRPKDACVINVSQKSSVFIFFLRLFCKCTEKGIYNDIQNCLSGWVQRKEYFLRLQPCWHKDHLPQWSVWRMERGSACCCHSGTKKVTYLKNNGRKQSPSSLLIQLGCFYVLLQQHQTYRSHQTHLWRNWAYEGPSGFQRCGFHHLFLLYHIWGKSS